MAKQSRGTCSLCGYESTKAGLTRHLATCPANHDLSTGKPSRLFRLRIEASYAPEYWLDVEIKETATLRVLDQFLRDIWLECCGHLSAFTIGDTFYDVSYEGDEEDEAMEAEAEEQLFALLKERGIPESRWPARRRERGMDVKISEIFEEGLSFEHEYDFGSTTHLKLKVVSEREGKISDKLRLLARNKLPEWTCVKCGKPATVLHSEKMYDEENPFYCKTHARGWDDYPYMPIVNSPRMGVCGYTG